MMVRPLIAIAFAALPVAYDVPSASQTQATIGAPVASVVERMPRNEAGPILGTKVMVAGTKLSGMLVDVLVDQSGQPRAAVIDFGGFLGIGDRHVAVAWQSLQFAPGDPGRPITLALGMEQLKAAPSYTNPDKPAPVVGRAAAPGGDGRPASQ